VTHKKQFSDIRALVADDNGINRMILVEMLSQAGVEADIATNGREAVEMVRIQDYDILFMDIEMPVMDGISATREIRAQCRESVQHLPILAMTAHNLAVDREKCIEAGMNDHLSKPVSRNALAGALRQWIPRGIFVTVANNDPNQSTKQDLLFLSPHSALDMTAGLNRLGGNRELYLRLLRDFIAGYGDTTAKLLQELRENRRDEAVRRIHAIRGVAGNLGGEKLKTAAAELEKVCRVEESVVPLSLEEPLHVFIDCHESLMMAIGAVLTQHPAVSPAKPEGPPAGIAELRPFLEGLRKALLSEEPRPCKEMLAGLLQRRWPANQEVVLNELNRLVQRYLLVEALTLFDKEFMAILGKSEEN
jgi:two-component system sensor histidine kinase/response regulator